jgi:adenylosuccinate lyase
MRANIMATNGFILSEAVMLALANKLGKQSAHRLVYEVAMKAQSEGLHLQQALINDRQITTILTNDEIAVLFDLEKSTGACADMVDQVIAQIHLA